jgi:hypothetical protein
MHRLAAKPAPRSIKEQPSLEGEDCGAPSDRIRFFGGQPLGAPHAAILKPLFHILPVPRGLERFAKQTTSRPLPVRRVDLRTPEAVRYPPAASGRGKPHSPRSFAGTSGAAVPRPKLQPVCSSRPHGRGMHAV